MELLTNIYAGIQIVKFAFLAIPERHLQIAAFVTPIIVFGGMLLLAFREHLLTKNNAENAN